MTGRVPPDLESVVLAALEASMPGYLPARMTLLGAGSDHRVIELDGTLVVRVAAEGADPGRSPTAEADLLRALAGVLPIPVPLPVFADDGRGVLGYRKAAGTPLLELPAPDRTSAIGIGRELGGLLATVHGLGPDERGGWDVVDAAPPQEYRASAADAAISVRTVLPAELREAVDAFLAAGVPEPPATPVFSHQDLGIEHVLVQDGRITGIIDWSDAAVGDPARDFGLVLRDLGPDALDAALDGYRRAGGPLAIGPELRRSIVFHARCALIEDWAHGLADGRGRYAKKSARWAENPFGGPPS